MRLKAMIVPKNEQLFNISKQPNTFDGLFSVGATEIRIQMRVIHFYSN